MGKLERVKRESRKVRQEVTHPSLARGFTCPTSDVTGVRLPFLLKITLTNLLHYYNYTVWNSTYYILHSMWWHGAAEIYENKGEGLCTAKRCTLLCNRVSTIILMDFSRVLVNSNIIKVLHSIRIRLVGNWHIHHDYTVYSYTMTHVPRESSYVSHSLPNMIQCRSEYKTSGLHTYGYYKQAQSC